MWIELCSNKFFNLDEAEMIYAEINKEMKYDVKISPKRNHEVKHRDLMWMKDFENFESAITFIRKAVALKDFGQCSS